MSRMSPNRLLVGIGDRCVRSLYRSSVRRLQVVLPSPPMRQLRGAHGLTRPQWRRRPPQDTRPLRVWQGRARKPGGGHGISSGQGGYPILPSHGKVVWEVLAYSHLMPPAAVAA